MISVTIPLVEERSITGVLDSVFSSTYSQFEVIVNDSSTGTATEQLKDILGQYDLRLIRQKLNRLHSRWMMADHARGDHLLMLDATRRIDPQLLRRLEGSESDLAFVGEKEVGNAPWSGWAELDRVASRPLTIGNLKPTLQLYCIPRYYQKELYLRACDRARGQLGAWKFEQISTADLEIPFIEAFGSAVKPEVFPEPLISHEADDGLLAIVTKYFNYGRGAKLLDGTPYSFVTRLDSHRRDLRSLSKPDRVRIGLMLGLRGVPFFLGYRL